jgi:hypothetical protein
MGISMADYVSEDQCALCSGIWVSERDAFRENLDTIPGREWVCDACLEAFFRSIQRGFRLRFAEQQARGGKRVAVADQPKPKAPHETVPVSLTTGKINAVRAAFKAGVKPTQIARQFGISQSDVRKVLVAEKKWDA